MKRILALPCLFLCACFLNLGCNKDSNSTTLTVRLADGPADYQQVNVEVKEVDVNFTGDTTSWKALPTNAGVYDLLKLQNGVDTLLASASVPTGTLRQIRLILGTNNTVMVNNTTYPLSVPSGTETGYKIDLTKNLSGSQTVVIDFHAAPSIVPIAFNTYQLKPVLTAK
jgi:Domain of unknown function (DUF4382)